MSVVGTPTVPIRLEPLFDLDLEIGAIHPVGAAPTGQRVIADLGGGTFEGPRLRGIVRPSGGDWGLFMPDGTLRVDGRCCLEVDDGALVYGIYKGRWQIAPETMARLGSAGGVDPTSEYTLRITFEFEAPTDGPHDWLNQVMAIAAGRWVEGGIRYEVWAVR